MYLAGVPLTFDQLELINDGLDDIPVEGEDAREARTRAAQLWIGLARSEPDDIPEAPFEPFGMKVR